MTKDEALKLALEWLDTDDSQKIKMAKHFIEQALAQEQESVAEIVSNVNGCLSTQWSEKWSPNPGDKLYTTPPQRTWVKLTDEENWQIATDCTIGGDLHADKFARAIEAKLKERNT